MNKNYKFQQCFFALLFIAQTHFTHTSACMSLSDSRYRTNSMSLFRSRQIENVPLVVPVAQAAPVVQTRSVLQVAPVQAVPVTQTASVAHVALAPAIPSVRTVSDSYVPATVVAACVAGALDLPSAVLPNQPQPNINNILSTPIHTIPDQRLAVTDVKCVIENIVENIKKRKEKFESDQRDDLSTVVITLEPNERFLPIRRLAYDQRRSIYRGTTLITPVAFSVHSLAAGPIIFVGGLAAAPVITIPGIIAGVSVGAGLAIKWIVGAIKARNIKRIQEQSGGGGGDGGKDPNDPDDKNKKDKKDKFDPAKHPHGEYENNPKHHQNSKGDIGKPPRDGQAALDNSIVVPGKERARVSIQDQKFVMFKQHSPGKWHGYVIERFKDLRTEAQNALIDAGLCKSKSGKIIK